MALARQLLECRGHAGRGVLARLMALAMHDAKERSLDGGPEGDADPATAAASHRPESRGRNFRARTALRAPMKNSSLCGESRIE
jgi:hypothetical protein